MFSEDNAEVFRQTALSREPCNVLTSEMHRYAAKDLYNPLMVMLAGILGRLRQFFFEIHRPIIDRVTLLHIQQRPSVLEAVTTTKSWRAAAGSWSFPMLQKFY